MSVRSVSPKLTDEEVAAPVLDKMQGMEKLLVAASAAASEALCDPSCPAGMRSALSALSDSLKDAASVRCSELRDVVRATARESVRHAQQRRDATVAQRKAQVKLQETSARLQQSEKLNAELSVRSEELWKLVQDLRGQAQAEVTDGDERLAKKLQIERGLADEERRRSEAVRRELESRIAGMKEDLQRLQGERDEMTTALRGQADEAESLRREKKDLELRMACTTPPVTASHPPPSSNGDPFSQYPYVPEEYTGARRDSVRSPQPHSDPMWQPAIPPSVSGRSMNVHSIDPRFAAASEHSLDANSHRWGISSEHGRPRSSRRGSGTRQRSDALQKPDPMSKWVRLVCAIGCFAGGFGLGRRSMKGGRAE